jgi:hypothetical protein
VTLAEKTKETLFLVFASAVSEGQVSNSYGVDRRRSNAVSDIVTGDRDRCVGHRVR